MKCVRVTLHKVGVVGVDRGLFFRCRFVCAFVCASFFGNSSLSPRRQLFDVASRERLSQLVADLLHIIVSPVSRRVFDDQKQKVREILRDEFLAVRKAVNKI